MLNTGANKGRTSGGFFNDCSGETITQGKEANTYASSSIKAKANAVTTSLSSPTKGGRAMSKKQQKLAEAAKSSHNISNFFMKKQTPEKSQDEEEMPREPEVALALAPASNSQENINQEPHSPAASEGGENSAAQSETEDVILVESKSEIIVIPDDDEEDGAEIAEPVQETAEQDLTSITEYLILNLIRNSGKILTLLTFNCFFFPLFSHRRNKDEEELKPSEEEVNSSEIPGVGVCHLSNFIHPQKSFLKQVFPLSSLKLQSRLSPPKAL